MDPWEAIDEEPLNPDLTEVQKDILDRRINDLDASPHNVLTREEIKARVRVRGPADGAVHDLGRDCGPEH